MELFSVKRYTNEITTSESRNEKEILEKLLQKVEKRKKKKKQHAADDSGADINSQEPKIKKNKIVAESSNDVTENAEIDPIAGKEENEAEDIDVTEGAVGFEVIGEDIEAAAKRKKVDVVLPPWLAHPTIITTDIAKSDADGETSITNLKYLTTATRQALKELNITRLFPVQTAVVPWLLEAHSKPPPFRPRDICVSAPTGSGKTLAFAIPLVQLLANRVERKIRALIVLPVAELALQVFKVLKKLCEKTDLSVCLLSKAFAFPLEQEKLVECYKGAYYSKVDIVVTTPGRLVDHLHATKGFCLKSLKFLVIDEADRIMDAVFQNWLYHLDEHVRSTSDQLLSGRTAPLCYNELLQSSGKQPHKLLFSATLSQDPEKLQNLRLFHPKLFTSVLASVEEMRMNFANAALATENKDALRSGEFIGKYTTPAELTEKYCITENRVKPLTLFSLINENGWQKFLCFTNSAESSSRLAFVLGKLCGDQLAIEELSSTISAMARARVLSKFLRGKINGLICSDALARGIDIPDVDIVISYDPARHIKTYIHRIGRTARAGRKGTAITLLTQKELENFNQTLAGVGKVITQEISVATNIEEQYAQSYTFALKELRQKIEKDKLSKILRKERTKKKAHIHRDPTELTLMEKLQVQADEHLHNKMQDKEKLELQTQQNIAKKSKKKIFKGHKFNASAGKNNAIKR